MDEEEDPMLSLHFENHNAGMIILFLRKSTGSSKTVHWIGQRSGLDDLGKKIQSRLRMTFKISDTVFNEIQDLVCPYKYRMGWEIDKSILS